MADQDNETKPKSEDNEISEKQKFRESSSPTAGCAILGTIVTVFVGLIVLYTVVGIYQNKKHHEFTDETAREIPVMEPTPDQIEKANQTIFKIFAAAIQNTSERVKLTADDLNALIATNEKAKDYRGKTFVKKITEAGMEVEMSHPVRQMGFGKPNRYLNATFVFKPEMRARTIAFRVIDIRKDDREVEFPKAYIESFAALDFFRLNPEDEDMGPVLRKIGRVYTEPDNLIVETRIELNN